MVYLCLAHDLLKVSINDVASVGIDSQLSPLIIIFMFA